MYRAINGSIIEDSGVPGAGTSSGSSGVPTPSKNDRDNPQLEAAVGKLLEGKNYCECFGKLE